MIAYKLFRIRRDGTLGSLFINRGKVIVPGMWLEAEDHPTGGYAHRPGWHCGREPYAPHLKEEGRTWFRVAVRQFYVFPRPRYQGGEWIIARWMRVLDEIKRGEQT